MARADVVRAVPVDRLREADSAAPDRVDREVLGAKADLVVPLLAVDSVIRARAVPADLLRAADLAALDKVDPAVRVASAPVAEDRADLVGQEWACDARNWKRR